MSNISSSPAFSNIPRFGGTLTQARSPHFGGQETENTPHTTTSQADSSAESPKAAARKGFFTRLQDTLRKHPLMAASQEGLQVLRHTLDWQEVLEAANKNSTLAQRMLATLDIAYARFRAALTPPTTDQPSQSASAIGSLLDSLYLGLRGALAPQEPEEASDVKETKNENLSQRLYTDVLKQFPMLVFQNTFPGQFDVVKATVDGSADPQAAQDALNQLKDRYANLSTDLHAKRESGELADDTAVAAEREHQLAEIQQAIRDVFAS